MDTIVTAHKPNFENLKRAFMNDQVLLMECTEKATGEKVAVICAYVFDGKDYNITPFAKFFNGNPYELLEPPTNTDGTTEKV